MHRMKRRITAYADLRFRMPSNEVLSFIREAKKVISDVQVTIVALESS